MTTPTGAPLRWDIHETHLEEAAFRWSQWEKALDAPDFTLEEVAELEEAVAAHVDGLVLGGEPVATRLLVPALTEDPERIVAAALALLGAEAEYGPALVLAALPSAEPPALAALQRALELSPASSIPTSLPSLLGEDTVPERLALVLDTLGVHGLATAPLCTPFLTHPEPEVAAAALRAVSRARLPLEPALLQRALDSRAPVLRDAAILAGLMGGHRAAWTTCQAVANSHLPGGRLPLLLLAMGGEERDMKRLLELLSDEKLRPDVLWALGFSGRVAAADACVELLRHPPVSALAGEAFSAITGLIIAEQYAVAREEEDTALPPLEEEDLDADLTSKPEDALPLPRPQAISEWWGEARQRMDVKHRYLSGQPFTPQALLEALTTAPMRRRHALALDLALRSRGAVQVPTRAFVPQQLAAWKAARAAPGASWSRPFAEALRG
ncbi:TIGR02270 family protein [Corallococcus praedator]|uniref:TIGR02270 family protein n=1 Tax=Corallococcus praedator TaxID=2316724 RepID=A0ABX9QNB3_9BACT|nr:MULTISPECIES: TIGR02270 family protein [Corallococcus]RKH15025.1 TIGR02270 family protein [Corallococcus sp. CA047B]RKH32028.1 TIGR02270 family protein [Corallococcus sp. CA031C]RKI12097.1 TIGR02270 family protein [Corallococcus praedator]